VRRNLTAGTVARLVAAQFPHCAHLPVTAVTEGGWDNCTFRLGENLVARLPSAEAYVAQVEKEHRWLPILAPHLPLPIPEPVAMGSPDDGFRYPWSIYRWIDGEPASTAPTPKVTELARDLAGFLGALYAIEAGNGPILGRHNFSRGGSLDV
jgi:aminoglycoside phosphotransferase (APT) family kinase protein